MVGQLTRNDLHEGYIQKCACDRMHAILSTRRPRMQKSQILLQGQQHSMQSVSVLCAQNTVWVTSTERIALQQCFTCIDDST